MVFFCQGRFLFLISRELSFFSREINGCGNSAGVLKEVIMIREAIIKLANKEDIGFEMAEAVMNEIMSGEATEVQKAAYLTALSMKGETIDEITASAKEMRRHCVRFLNDEDVLEIVGTGGDRSNSFNISTTSSIIIAAAGIPVAKHGNRAASSRSGAADCFEALGVNIQVSPDRADLVEQRIIDGRPCLVIPITDEVQVNGIRVRNVLHEEG